jgi:hypothetical protein
MSIIVIWAQTGGLERNSALSTIVPTRVFFIGSLSRQAMFAIAQRRLLKIKKQRLKSYRVAA